MIKLEGLVIEVEPKEAIKRFRTVTVQKLADGIWHIYAELEYKDENAWPEVIEGAEVSEVNWNELVLMKCNGDCKHIATLKFRRDWDRADDGVKLFWITTKYGVEVVVVSDEEVDCKVHPDGTVTCSVGDDALDAMCADIWEEMYLDMFGGEEEEDWEEW